MAIMTGQRHWQSPDQLRIKREPGWGYRYMKKQDVERRIDEGWEIVSSPLREKNEGGPIDRAQHYRGLILMRMPLGMVEQRNKYYHDLHNRRLRAVARGAHMSAVHKAMTSEGSETEDGRPLASTIGQGLIVRQGTTTDEGLTHTDNMDIPLKAHPDDLREDAQVIEEMEKEKSVPENGEGEEPAKVKSTRTYKKKRR